MLIGLITPASMTSAYVTFELGARWGAAKPIIPLLASGATPAHLGGPLAGIKALDASRNGQVHELVEEVARQLKLETDKPSSYAAAISELVRISKESGRIQGWNPDITTLPQLSNDAKELLLEAARDPAAMILIIRTMGGAKIQTNAKLFGERGNRRSEARWEQAISDLQAFSLVEDRLGKGQGFAVTHAGFELAAKLAKPM